MSDIVERLRSVAHTYDEHGVHSEIELEAANEIEKLRAQNERLATSNHAYLSNYQEAADEIEKLRAALQTARRDALEEAEQAVATSTQRSQAVAAICALKRKE